jgi:hypothetical protein
MDREEEVLEAWKTAVNVQMHFNDLGMRIRSFAITVLAAFLAATGYTVKEGIRIDLFGWQASLTGFLLLGGLVCWGAFYIMDRLWYHRLLLGAVRHGIAIENAHVERLPEIALATKIGEESPVYIGKKKVGSERKMDIFYGIVALLLIGAAVAAFLNKPPPRPSVMSDTKVVRIEVVHHS